MAAKHHELTSIHRGAFVGPTDPALDAANHVTADKLWVDTSTGPPFVILVRNAANDGWNPVGAGSTGGGSTLVNEALTGSGAAASASSTESGFPASGTIDNVEGTRWQEASADTTSVGAWLEVDLGSPKAISRFSYVALTTGPATWKLQSSTDHSAWTDRHSGTGLSLVDQDIAGGPFTAQWWRFIGVTESNIPSSWIVDYVKLYSGSAGTGGSLTHGSLSGLTSGDDHTQYQKESERGVADGYAPLDSGILVPAGMIPALNLLTAPAGDLSLNTHKITNLVDPTSAQDAATKAYVDGLINGLSWKPSVRVASTANVVIASALENGDVIDGVTLSTGDRVLLKNQTAGAENGIYVVVASGAASRSADTDSAADILQTAVSVREGSTNADTMWVLTTNGPITLGTTALTFSQWGSGSGGSLTVREIDGTPSMTATVIEVTNAKLTDMGSGVARLDLSGGGGGSLTVKDIDGTPSVTATTLEFPNGTVTDQGSGVARYTPAGGGGGSDMMAAKVTPPVSTSGWTWINQNGATATDHNNDVVLYYPTNDTNLHAFVRAVSGAWTLVAAFHPLHPVTAAFGSGLTFFDGTLGRFLTAYVTLVSGVPQIAVNYFTNFSTWFSGPTTFFPPTVGQPCWMKFTDDGSNRTLSWSSNGRDWYQMWTDTHANFLTASHVGVLLIGLDAKVALTSWELT